MAKKYKEEPYFVRLAEKLVREGMDIWDAAQELELGLQPEFVKKLLTNPTFKAVIGLERVRYYREIGSDPKRDKDYLVGMNRYIIEKLIEEEEFKDAAEAIQKCAKLEGHIGPDVTANVFGNLSPSELSAVIEKLKTQKSEPEVVPDSSVQ
jgi:hypothetical protein